MINEDKTVNVVHMNLSKTFDKFPHGILIQKLKMLEIHDDLVVCMSLADPHMTEGNRHFGQKAMASGVLQASALGLLLFEIYISDLDINVDGVG